MKINILFPYRKNNDFRRQRNLDFTLGHYNKFVQEYSDQIQLGEIVLADDDHSLFNRGRALHNAYLEQKELPDLMIFADADLIVPFNRLLHGCSLVYEEPSYVVPFSEVHYLNDQATEVVMDGGDFQANYPNTTYWKNKSTGGLNILTPEAYEKSGGFDPRFIDWGFEDAAFDAQMQTLVGPCKWVTGPAYHLYHHSARKGNSPQFRESNILCDKYRTYIDHKGLMNSLLKECPRNWRK